MKIKKVDDRPIIIHTKEKARIHIHENQDAKIEGHNIEEVDHSSMSTIHQNRLRNLNPISQYRQKRKDSNRSVKVKNSTIKNAGLISANTTVNQLEGGEEIFKLTINENQFACKGMNIQEELMALSLDGKELFLITYEDGPSGDPLSMFYRYHEGTFEKMGYIVDDIRNCKIKDNEIIGLFRCDLIQTQLAYGSWKLNSEGKLEQVVADEYNLYNEQNTTTLIKNLPVHKEKNLSSETSIITPQKIVFTKSDAKNWTYVEGADGTSGWMYSNENREIEELGLAVGDVFENLVLYD